MNPLGENKWETREEDLIQAGEAPEGSWIRVTQMQKDGKGVPRRGNSIGKGLEMRAVSDSECGVVERCAGPYRRTLGVTWRSLGFACRAAESSERVEAGRPCGVCEHTCAYASCAS